MLLVYKESEFNTINRALLPVGVHNLDRVVCFTHGTMILCVCLGSVVQCQNGGHYTGLVTSQTIMPFTRKE